MNEQLLDGVIDESFFNIERLLNGAMASKVLEALFAWKDPEELYFDYKVEFRQVKDFTTLGAAVMPLTKVDGYNIIGILRHEHSETPPCLEMDELDEMFGGPIVIDSEILTIYITEAM